MDDQIPEGAIPIDQFKPAAQPEMDDSSPPPGAIPLDQFKPANNEEKFGTLPQQALTAVEGGAQGIAGPIATAAEEGLRKLGVPGLSAEERRGRAETNPATHGLSEAGTFIVSMLTGTGEAALLSKIGEGAVGAAGKAAEAVGLAKEAYPAISRIASHGIAGGAEMAALQTGNEISKQINQDPGASLGNAISNVGLSALLGGVAGTAIGTISPAISKTIDKMGIPKLIDDAKATLGFRQSNPDVASAVTNELNTRMNEVNNIRYNWSALKGEPLEKALPEVNPENNIKIDSQIKDISTKMEDSISKASDNAYLKGAIPKLNQDYKDFLEVVTNPSSTYAEKYGAIDDLKNQMQSKVNYGKKFNVLQEDTAVGKFIDPIAKDFKLKLEDSDVWGKAGDVQREVNAAVTKSATAEREALGKFTKKEMNDLVPSQERITTLLNQASKGKALDRTNAINNYLEHTDNLAETLNKIHTDAGLPAPIAMTPTAATDFALKKSSPGNTLGNWLYDKGASSLIGHAASGPIGAGLGSLVGHPVWGAIAGEKFLSPVISSIAKPMVENATNHAAFKATIDYVSAVAKGERLLNDSTRNLFKGSAQVIPDHLYADSSKNEKLQKSLDHIQDPEKMAQVGGSLDHYLPDHSSNAVFTASTAKQYLDAAKPKPVKLGILDSEIEPTKEQMALYDRKLSIAESPLSILPLIKNGTILPQDVQTLKTIYPAYYNKMSQEILHAMTEHTEGKGNVPYDLRQSLSLFLGHPLDSTMIPSSMMAAQSVYINKAAQQQDPSQQGSKSKKNTSKLGKISENMETADQHAESRNQTL